jgi:hypothetical protein
MPRATLLIIAATISAAAAFKTNNKPSPSLPALRLRGGVTPADVAHYGTLFLDASVGLPGLLGGADLLFKINYPGFDWAGYTAKWTPESASYLDTMTRFFSAALLLVGALQYYAKGVMDAKTYYGIICASQAVFGAIQVLFGAPKAAMPECHYAYAGSNVLLGIAAAMAM